MYLLETEIAGVHMVELKNFFGSFASNSVMTGKLLAGEEGQVAAHT
jgi:hypothetical protein